MAGMKAGERWSKDVAHYDVPHLRLRTVAHLINELKPKTLVDLGCAKGTLRSLIPSAQYTGCDFIAPRDEHDFRFFRCDFNRETTPDAIRNSEMVVASGLLEYIEDLPAFISEIRDMLIGRGMFIATYFNANHFSRRLRKIGGKKLHHHPDWTRIYPLDELRQIISERGFQINKIVPLNHSLSVARPVGETVNEEVQIDRFHLYSPLFAHQFILVCEKTS